MDINELGRRLRAARLGAGFTSARAFARSLGVDNSYVSRLEDGLRDPSLSMLERWASACGLVTDVVLRDPNRPTEAVELPPAAATVARRLAHVDDDDLALIGQLLDALPLEAKERDTLQPLLLLLAKKQRRENRETG